MKTAPYFKIAILEDDDFYNKLLTHHLKNCLQQAGLVQGFTCDVQSYTSYKDWASNFDNETTLLFTDYFLSDGYRAPDVIQFVKAKSSGCKVVVMSQLQNLQTAVVSILEGAYDFFKKDYKLLFRCQDISETIICEKLGKVN